MRKDMAEWHEKVLRRALQNLRIKLYPEVLKRAPPPPQNLCDKAGAATHRAEERQQRCGDAANSKEKGRIYRESCSYRQRLFFFALDPQEQLPSSGSTVPPSTPAMEMVQDEGYQTNLEGNGKSQTTVDRTRHSTATPATLPDAGENGWEVLAGNTERLIQGIPKLRHLRC